MATESAFKAQKRELAMDTFAVSITAHKKGIPDLVNSIKTFIH